MENRITITDCTKEKFDRFVSEVNKISTVINRKPANAKTPQDRLTLGFNNDRVSVVWESKSQKLILTASEGSLNAVKAVYDKESFSSKTTDKIVDKAKQGNNKDNDGNMLMNVYLYITYDPTLINCYMDEHGGGSLSLDDNFIFFENDMTKVTVSYDKA